MKIRFVKQGQRPDVEALLPVEDWKNPIPDKGDYVYLSYAKGIVNQKTWISDNGEIILVIDLR